MASLAKKLDDSNLCSWESELEQQWQAWLGIPLLVSIANQAFPVESLTSGEFAFYQSLPASRQDSWLRGRGAAKAVMGRLGVSTDTSRISWPNSFLSLSHSGCLAIAVGSLSKVRGIGVDLEMNRPIPSRAFKYYLQPKETLAVYSERDSLRLWTVKEALFKSDPENLDRLLFHYETRDATQSRGQAQSLLARESCLWQYASTDLDFGYITLALLP